jgi:DNA-binding response OmpR family regulator
VSNVPNGIERRKRVLVIDDEPYARRVVQEALEPEIEVLQATSGRAGLRVFFLERPDLVVLDARMPDLDGFETLRRIRDLSDTPVIMLTGVDSESEVVRALELGADEYLNKPFSPASFVARVRAVLRRAELTAPPDEGPLRLCDGELVIDRAAGRVWVRDREVELSATEYRLLICLASHAGQVLSAAQLLERVWGPKYADATGNVKSYVRLLRGKIEPEPGRPRYILSRRGLGYMLAQRGQVGRL